MGQQAQCRLRIDGRTSEGRALLETDDLLFRGGVRLKIPFVAIRRVDSDAGRLTVAFEGGTAVFELGQNADRSAEKLRKPKSLLDKLGVKPGMKVAIVGDIAQTFVDELRGRTSFVRHGRPSLTTDLIFFAATTNRVLVRLHALREALADSGAVWVVRPKGRSEITEAAVMAAGKAAGLVDVKVVKFSETHTAEKFVIPVARRKSPGR